MGKRKPRVNLHTCGIYEQWDPDARGLPRFLCATRKIPAEVGVEFGYVVTIVGGKNMQLTYCIDHPGILDDAGQRRAPFDGSVYVRTNDWKFYLGDSIWEPITDKLGNWRMTLELDGKLVADETFEVAIPG